MTTIATLTIEMAANVARLQTDMQAARGVVERSTKAMTKAADIAGKALGMLGVALTVGAFTGFLRKAIDSADATSKLAQKTGLLVSEVAGLQLAFRQSGNGADVMQTSIAKLSKGMADGNKAFAAMGLEVQNTDGKLKSTRQMMGEVADKFATYADGAEKTALAQQLFGKSGADLIPLLNAGSEALDDYDDKARRLGLTLSDETVKQAEAFNDTLDLAGQAITGVGTQIAAKLLPTLTSLASEFLSTLTDGDLLNDVVVTLTNTFKGLFSVGVGVSEVFKTMGTVLGGAAAGAVALMKGNWAEANAIGEMIGQDLTASWKKAGQSITNAWNEVDTVGVAAMVSVTGAARVAAPVVATIGTAAKAAADEFAKLRSKINAKDSGTDTDFLKNMQLLQKAQREGRIGMEEYIALAEKYVRSQKYMQDAEKATAKAAQEAADARKKEAEGIQAFLDAQAEQAAQALAGVEDRVAALKLEATAVALAQEKNITLAVAIEQVVLARLRERQASFREGSEGYLAIEREIEARRELIGLIEQQEGRKAAEALGEEAAKMSAGIEQTLTDALMRGFESGKDFAKNMKDTILNMFKTMVLRPMIQATLSMGGGGLSGAANAATGGAGGGGPGLLGNLGSLASGAGLLGAAGLGMQATIGAVMTNGFAGLGAAISGGFAAIGTGTAAGIAAGLGMIALPIAAIALLWKPLFGRKLKDSGIQGEFGGESGFEGANYEFYRGGLFRSDKTKTNPIDEEMRRVLGDTFLAMKEQVTDFASTLGLNADRLKDFTTSIKISTKGLDEDKAKEKIQEALATVNNELAEQVIGSWVETTEMVKRRIAYTYADEVAGRDVMGGGYDVEEETTTRTYKPSEFARDGEKAIDTLTRLATSLTTVNGIWDVLGNTALEASLAGGDMASSIVDAFGGIEPMLKATSSYYQNFYTDSEKFGNSQRMVREQLEKLGLAMPSTIAQYRAMVEAQDRTTEAGRAAYASLINLSGAFYEVAAAVEEAFDNISRTTAQSIRDIQMSVMGDAEKYGFLDSEINSLIAQLSNATLPADIERLFNEANSATTQAYGLLGPDEQKRLNAAFVDRLWELEAIAQARLDAAGELPDVAADQAQAAADQRESAATQREAAIQMSEAASEMLRAARESLAAALTPKTIEVRLTGGASAANEVSFA